MYDMTESYGDDLQAAFVWISSVCASCLNWSPVIEVATVPDVSWTKPMKNIDAPDVGEVLSGQLKKGACRYGRCSKVDVTQQVRDALLRDDKLVSFRLKCVPITGDQGGKDGYLHFLPSYIKLELQGLETGPSPRPSMSPTSTPSPKPSAQPTTEPAELQWEMYIELVNATGSSWQGQLRSSIHLSIESEIEMDIAWATLSVIRSDENAKDLRLNLVLEDQHQVTKNNVFNYVCNEGFSGEVETRMHAEGHVDIALRSMPNTCKWVSQQSTTTTTAPTQEPEMANTSHTRVADSRPPTSLSGREKGLVGVLCVVVLCVCLYCLVKQTGQTNVVPVTRDTYPTRNNINSNSNSNTHQTIIDQAVEKKTAEEEPKGEESKHEMTDYETTDYETTDYETSNYETTDYEMGDYTRRIRHTTPPPAPKKKEKEKKKKKKKKKKKEEEVPAPAPAPASVPNAPDLIVLLAAADCKPNTFTQSKKAQAEKQNIKVYRTDETKTRGLRIHGREDMAENVIYKKHPLYSSNPGSKSKSKSNIYISLDEYKSYLINEKVGELTTLLGMLGAESAEIVHGAGSNVDAKSSGNLGGQVAGQGATTGGERAASRQTHEEYKIKFKTEQPIPTDSKCNLKDFIATLQWYSHEKAWESLAIQRCNSFTSKLDWDWTVNETKLTISAATMKLAAEFIGCASASATTNTQATAEKTISYKITFHKSFTQRVCFKLE
jgi:hypothetical protein